MSRPRRRSRRSPFAVGLIALVVIASSSTSASRSTSRSPRLPGPGHVRVGQRPAARLARADRRRQRRQGQEGRRGGGHGQRGRDDGDRRRGPPDRARTPRRRSARASSSRATSSSTCSPARPAREELDDGGMLKVTQTATPVQLDQVLTALQSDTRQDLQDVLDGLGPGAAAAKPSAADDAQADPSARGETAAESFNDAYDDIGPAEKAQAQVNEALLGTEPERGPRPADRRPRPHRRRPRAQRGPAQGPRHQLQRHDGRARLRERQPAGLDPRAAGDARRRPTRRSTRSTPRSRRRARSRARSCPASARRPRRSTPRSRGSRRPAALMSQAELQGLAADLAPLTRDLAQFTDLLDEAAAAHRPGVQVRARRDPAHGRRRDPRRVPDRPRELQGLLLRDGRARRRGPELRRQRHLRALPDRRRLEHRLARPGQPRHRPAVRHAADAAARQPPGLPGPQAAVQDEPALLQAAAARPQRPGRRAVRAAAEPERAGHGGAHPAAEQAPPVRRRRGGGGR